MEYVGRGGDEGHWDGCSTRTQQRLRELMGGNAEEDCSTRTQQRLRELMGGNAEEEHHTIMQTIRHELTP
jgi:hypothetical protein